MRLAEPGAAVDEERVVRLRRRLGDCERGGVREAVRRADDERVERVLRVEAAALGPSRAGAGPWERRPQTAARALRRARSAAPATLSSIGRSTPTMSRIAAPIRPRKCPSIQSRVNSFGTVEHERVALEHELVDVTEPLAVRPVAQGLLEPSGNLLPEVLCRQLDLVFHRRPDPPRLRPGGQHNSGFAEGKTSRFAGCFRAAKIPPQLWTSVGETPSARIAAPSPAVDKTVDGRRRLAILTAAPRRRRGFFWQRRAFSHRHEAHLSAQRPPPQAQARLPRAHVDEGRPGDPEAAPRQGPRAPLCLVGSADRATKLHP